MPLPSWWPLGGRRLQAANALADRLKTEAQFEAHRKIIRSMTDLD